MAAEVRAVCFTRLHGHFGRSPSQYAWAPGWAPFLANMDEDPDRLTIECRVDVERLKERARTARWDTEESRADALRKLSSFLKGVSGGLLTEVYRRVSVCPRVFARGCSLQNLPKVLRRAALPGHHELDIVNAHPTILNHLTGGKRAALATYAAHPKEVRDEIVETTGRSLGEVKQYLLVSSYGAGPAERRKALGCEPPPEFENGIVRDLQDARRELVRNLPNREALRHDAFEHNMRKRENPGVTWKTRARWAHARKDLTIASWVLQQHERVATMAALAVCRHLAVGVSVYLHDGLYIQKWTNPTEITRQVRTMTGLPLTFVIKEDTDADE